MTKQLILGGARSGKSRYAEQLAMRADKTRVYIATAEALDAEMAARISQHRDDREASWIVIEEPVELAQALADHDAAEHCVLIDCLTLWVSNCLHRECWQQESRRLLELLPKLQAELIMVSNEVGSGIVPMGELSREFVDSSGRLHQQLAALCDRVCLIVAGLPLELKNEIGDDDGQ